MREEERGLGRDREEWEGDRWRNERDGAVRERCRFFGSILSLSVGLCAQI